MDNKDEERDIFQIFQIENREDKYTFVFCAFFKSSKDFRSKVADYFSMESTSLKCKRETFTLPEKTESGRTKITPDIVLYDNKKIVVIESKMFASEGDCQTLDYASESGKQVIKDSINKNNIYKITDLKFYFLTLSGIDASDKSFIKIKWADYYENILSDVHFNIVELECLRNSIYFQAKNFKEKTEAIEELKYKDLFKEKTYWLRPFSAFSSNDFDKMIDDGDYFVGHGIIQGQGHSDFCTSLYKDDWNIEGNGKQDNLRLFIRIEWASKGPIVWLGWEYYDKETGDYYKIRQIDPGFQEKAIRNLKDYKDVYNEYKPDIIGEFKSKTTAKRKDSIKALKCELSCDENKTVVDVIKDVKTIIKHYKGEIKKIISSMSVRECLFFDVEKYKTL